jgi:predicted ABC-type transport system involved in lysophospholipase L1 biosynthesis ATPase subunit
MFIQLEQIRKCYGEGDGMIAALDGVDLTVEKGEFIAIVGSSGSGKSTLLQILGCLDHADSGTYQLGGRGVQSLTGAEMARIRNETIGFVFQSFQLLAGLSALDNVILPLELAGTDLTTARATARDLLDQVGLGDRLTHPQIIEGG